MKVDILHRKPQLTVIELDLLDEDERDKKFKKVLTDMSISGDLEIVVPDGQYSVAKYLFKINNDNDMIMSVSNNSFFPSKEISIHQFLDLLTVFVGVARTYARKCVWLNIL